MDSWYLQGIYRHGIIVLTKAYGVDIGTWYIPGLLDRPLWYRYGLFVLTRTHGIDKDYGIYIESWY